MRLASTAAVGKLSLFKTVEVYPLRLAILKGIKPNGSAFIYSITKNIFKFSSQEHKQWLLFRLDFYIQLCKGMNSSPLPVGMVIQYYGEITLQLS